jgi:DNA-binding NarL/FixJ family response regulator
VKVIRVLVADDQSLVRDGFRALIEREPDLTVVAEASDGLEAIDRTRRHHPDVILMDIRMPHVDGLSATRQILAPSSSASLAARPRIIVLTTFDRNEWIFEALRAGASGFLLKDVRAAALVEAIRVVHAGEALLAPSVTRRLVEEFARSPTARSARSPELDNLTRRELDVLLLIAAGRSNTEIARALVVEQSTVKTHINRILTKLNLRDRTQAVVFAYENGLVVPGDPSAPTAHSQLGSEWGPDPRWPRQ